MCQFLIKSFPKVNELNKPETTLNKMAAVCIIVCLTLQRNHIETLEVFHVILNLII